MNNVIAVVNDKAEIVKEVQTELIQLATQEKAIKTRNEELKAELLKAMKENDIVKIDNDEVTVTVIEPTSRETFNSKKLREDMPDIYDEYVEVKNVAGSIRVKVK